MADNINNNIIMFPFMSQGHIIPFLALSLQLEQKGYKITFINTPLNVANIRRTLPHSSAIRLLEIPFNPSDHRLPPHCENTNSLPPNQSFDLTIAAISLKPAFRNILKSLVDGGCPPLCVVADFFFGWSAEVSHEFGIFHVIFNGSSGFGSACYYSSWINLPGKTSDSTEFTLPDFHEAGKLHVTQLTPSLVAATCDDPWWEFQKRNLPALENADGFLFNTTEKLDKVGLTYFRTKFRKPVWAIGPLSVENRPPAGSNCNVDAEKCLKFLSSKPPSSVLYISFGTQNPISSSQMMELAKALDESNKHYIWLVHPPLGFDINAEFRAEEWLPDYSRLKQRLTTEDFL